MGTEKSTTMPWKMAITANCCPDTCVMMGSVVSMDVAPAAEMGANLPKYLAMSGASVRVSTSLDMLASRAMVPSSAPLYSVMIMLESE